MAHAFIKNIKFTPTLRNFYCSYVARMPASSGLADPTYHDEIGITAADSDDAAKRVAAFLASAHPRDTLLSCSCKEIA